MSTIFIKGIKTTDNLSEPKENRFSVTLPKNEPLTVHVSVVDSQNNPVAINDPTSFVFAAVVRRGSSARIGYGSSLNTDPQRQKDGVVEFTLTMNSNVEPGEYMWYVGLTDGSNTYRLMEWSSFVVRK